MSGSRKIMFRPITAVCLAVAVVAIVVAVVYFTKTADALPSFFPGHKTGLMRHHTKHGIAFVGLAAVAVIAAWMTTAPKGSTRQS